MAPGVDAGVTRPVARRLLVTIVVCALAAAMPFVVAPGMAPEALNARHRFFAGPFVAGVWPVVTSFGLVELVAMLVPRWRVLRQTGARGRARLSAIAAILAVPIWAVSVPSMAQYLGAFTHGAAFPRGMSTYLAAVGAGRWWPGSSPISALDTDS